MWMKARMLYYHLLSCHDSQRSKKGADIGILGQIVIHFDPIDIRLLLVKMVNFGVGHVGF